MTVDWIFLGLGNPGPRYELTRHNIGFLFCDYLADLSRSNWDDHSRIAKKTQSHICQIQIGARTIMMLKPQTYMNLSGESLRGLYAEKPDWKSRPLLVFHDEVDIPPMQLRLKMGGGDAGHNGLKSIRQHLGHGDFYRLRMGVGRPPRGEHEIPLADYVLRNFSEQESPELISCFQQARIVTQELVERGLAKAQEKASPKNTPQKTPAKKSEDPS